MSKKNGVCKEEVCLCIRDAIINHDYNCMFVPKGEDMYDMYLNVWDEMDDEDDDVLVIVNPIDEFVLDNEIYYRLIKTISGDTIYDFRLTEEKFGIFIYLRKSQHGYADYVFYYKGKPIDVKDCPPTFYDVASIIYGSKEGSELSELFKHREVLRVIRGIEDLCSKFRNIIRYRI